MSNIIPKEKAFEFKQKLGELETALLSLHPTLPVLLREIHTQLRKDPEIVTLMSEEELGVLVNALKRQTQTEIVASTKKETATASIKKAAKQGGGSLIGML